MKTDALAQKIQSQIKNHSMYMPDFSRYTRSRILRNESRLSETEIQMTT
jgi:hypothetical protein